MKKLIISALAALALLFGVTSCSGDLHDDVLVDPNAMQGYWSYAILDASKSTSGTISIIVSDGTNQTADYDGQAIKKGDTLYYVWDGKSKSNLSVSTRTDQPTLTSLNVTLNSDEFAIFVFTPKSTCFLWIWDGETNLTGGTWPGVTTTATVQVAKVSETLTGATLTITGLPKALYNKDLYFTGSGYADGVSWPDPSTDGSIKGTVSTSGELKITFPDYTKEFEQGTTIEFNIEGKFAETSTWDNQVTFAGGENMSLIFTKTLTSLSFIYANSTGTKDGHTYYAVKASE